MRYGDDTEAYLEGYFAGAGNPDSPYTGAPVVFPGGPIRGNKAFKGTGPDRGVIEVSSRATSIKAFDNLRTVAGRDFVFDPGHEEVRSARQEVEELLVRAQLHPPSAGSQGREYSRR
ncbi:polymorphic toxin type 43 domain-containing protein [Nonomuraea basaltis]|uniref:polymorphic toxin type 43 domain-containing protein n=1 Tax=Nonomuraea basaltis TaxID=2495887 RepID=UPI00110C44C8|nr:hypothetical protein EJK15_05825 [Nonomuraea basaltis]